MHGIQAAIQRPQNWRKPSASLAFPKKSNADIRPHWRRTNPNLTISTHTVGYRNSTLISRSDAVIAARKKSGKPQIRNGITKKSKHICMRPQYDVMTAGKHEKRKTPETNEVPGERYLSAIQRGSEW